jgi:CTD small phosphatase-like protein 2
MYIKDLRIIDRDMRNMVLIDNAAYSYIYQMENGVPIFPYYHGQIDFELKMLEEYLMKLIWCQDIR